MIGRLKGRVEAAGGDHVILDVNGVGYVVHCSARTLGDLAVKDETEIVAMWIDTVVREDMIRLNGFITVEERDLFRLLQTVQNVGAKVAFGIMGAMSVADAATAIVQGDDKSLAKAPGCGPKTATRIVQDLKDKVPAELLGGKGGKAKASSHSEGGRDAVAALTKLGYPEYKASAAVSKAEAEAGLLTSTTELIRLALKHLATAA